MQIEGLSQDYVDEMLGQLGEFAYDPLGFVRWAYPWGEAGTELARYKEPYPWHIERLEAMGDALVTTGRFQSSHKSGHGVGKTAINTWTGQWGFATYPGARGVVTANTEVQLRTKTWVEMQKWFRLFIAAPLFQITATALFARDETLRREWRLDMVPWSEKNVEAFAGLHNAGKRIIVLFDEASGIPAPIWETTEGASTDLDLEFIWLAQGNPIVDSGRFRETFPPGRFAKLWQNKTISSYDVPGINKADLDAKVEAYGADSDYVRTRILGEFPRTGINSFISAQDVLDAQARPLLERPKAPWFIGVDPGRFGDDPSVIYPRQGFDARSGRIEIHPKLDVVALATRVANVAASYSPCYIFVDSGGVGGGVVDVLRSWGYEVYAVDFGAASDNPDPQQPTIKYLNKRAEIWGTMRAAMPTLCLPAENQVFGMDASFVEEFTGPHYFYNQREALALESKRDMRRRGVKSPNIADALATTYAYPVLGLEDSYSSSPALAPETSFNPFQQVA